MTGRDSGLRVKSVSDVDIAKKPRQRLELCGAMIEVWQGDMIERAINLGDLSVLKEKVPGLFYGIIEPILSRKMVWTGRDVSSIAVLVDAEISESRWRLVVETFQRWPKRQGIVRDCFKMYEKRDGWKLV